MLNHAGQSVRDRMSILATHDVDPTDTVFVFLAEEEKVSGRSYL